VPADTSSPPQSAGRSEAVRRRRIGPRTIWGVGYRYDQRVAANQTFTIRTTQRVI
jgi:hypothetical protein